MSEQIPKTPAEQMLPNPHIKTVADGEERFYSADDLVSLQKELANAGEYNFQGQIPPVTELGRAVTRLAQEARENTTDARSGLLNPKGLEMWFDRYKPEQFAFIMCDGRGFGQINKLYGHEVGNDVIRYMGQKITSELRVPGEKQSREEEIERKNSTANDVVGSVQVAQDIEGSVSARWGGDEFIIIADLTGLDDDQAEEALNKIHKRLDDFGVYKDEDKGISIPVSVRSASVFGKKSENKPFSYYQSEVDSVLQLVTEGEKSGKNREKEADRALANELNKLARRVDASTHLEELPKTTARVKVEFAGKKWEVLDLSSESNAGLDNFLYNVGNILEYIYPDDPKTKYFNSKGLTSLRIRGMFGDDFPNVLNEIQHYALIRGLINYGSSEDRASLRLDGIKSREEMLEERKTMDSILTTYAYWLLAENLVSDDDEHLLEELKK